MKKLLSIITAAAIGTSVFAMSGCDDFKFNPIGTWQNTEDILYDRDNIEYQHETLDTLWDFYYIFEKSGTGYMIVEGERTFNFTYEYDNNTITVYPEMDSKDAKQVKQEFKLSENNTKMTYHIDQIIYQTEEGEYHYFREDIIFVKQ